MKAYSLWTGLLCGLLLTVPGASAQTTDVDTLYKEGVKAYEAQNWAEAARNFAQVYKVTRNPRAQYYLRNAQLKLEQGVPSELLEAKLSKVIIPSIEFQETDLANVLDFLRKKVVELSAGKIQPNFLYKRDPHTPQPVVTLQLSNLPVTEVLRYVGQLTGTKFKYEQHAVLCTPSGSP